MAYLKISSLLIITLLSCRPTEQKKNVLEKGPITCTDKACSGTYKGSEFIKGSDVAHQFSNAMSGAVGNQLKKLYHEGTYSQVDFENITMTTSGMGSGYVVYYLSVPFIKVDKKCEAFTSFDHVGGWNHTPALEKRKRELSRLLLPKDTLYVSTLKKTPEGLEEYWIQWRHSEVQKVCEGF